VTGLGESEGLARSTNDLRQLLPRYLPQIETYVRRHMSRTLRDQESAADLVNSVCGDLLAEGVCFEYRSDAQFQSWLRTVVVNKIRGRLRFRGARKRQPPAPPPPPPPQGAAQVEQDTPSHLAILHEELGLLDRALSRLPDDYRNVIVRSQLCGQSTAQVADQQRRSVKATRSLLARALVKLAGELDRLQGAE
jgi:RNA polymerase sigma factor (sigma-70 family)